MLEIVRGVADEPELQGGELPFVESGQSVRQDVVEDDADKGCCERE